jgi:hypothetical protein
MQDKLRPGELVQIWDHSPDETCSPTITEHGSIGYLVKPSVQKSSITSGVIWEVICFGQDPPTKHHVHEEWLNLIHSPSDIKKKT